MQKLVRNIFRRSPVNAVIELNTPVTHERKVVPHPSNLPSQVQRSEDLAGFTQMASSFYSWLHMVAPAFPVKAENVHILSEPSEFYNTLLQKCSTAKNRIVFSSLYLGTGGLEKALVESIRKRLVDLEGHLKVTLLFDYCRGSRGSVNSRTMVTPLLQEQAECVQISLYHTVALRGLLRWILPQRFNEIIGLQHMKLYIFDNSLIISGANLSHDYFTNRQDRYVIIEDCPDLANFYVNLIQQVCEFSFQLMPNGSTVLHPSWPVECHPFKGDKKKFVDLAHERVWNALLTPMTAPQKSQDGADTWIFPLIQMGQLRITHDSEVTLGLLERSPLGAQIYLATGYFNLPKVYMDNILRRSLASYTVLTAHPLANGFLNARGMAGGIPALYTQLAKEFFLRVCKLGQQGRIQVKEYIQPGWTYHGKGLWLTLPDQQVPSLTLVGSPNFGSRSLERDLETQLAIVTSNQHLQRTLAKERDSLFDKGQIVTKSTFLQSDRLVPLWVFCISQIFRKLL